MFSRNSGIPLDHKVPDLALSLKEGSLKSFRYLTSRCLWGMDRTVSRETTLAKFSSKKITLET